VIDPVQLLTQPGYGVGLVIGALAEGFAVGFGVLALSLVFRRWR